MGTSTFRSGLVAAALLVSPIEARSQGRDTTARDTVRRATPLSTVTVTATRTARRTFDTPQSIVVLDSAQLREKIAPPIELFRDVAGLDVSGVGSNQRRPEIRGLRGQRVLLLADGLRLTNARRQQDFGELPALAGDGAVSRVEVVRGPASVLYGSDAIGGVINLISAPLPGSDDLHGSIAYRYGSAGKESSPNVTLAGRRGRVAVRLNAGYRDAEAYRAPAGTFGNITFDDDVRVHDSGVRDRSHDATLSFDVSSAQEVYVRGAWYEARRAGFGYVDPALLGPNQPLIQIRYPAQDFARYAVGYRGAASLGIADRFDVSGYTQRNERELDTRVFVPFSTPGAGVTSHSLNFTDLETFGGRFELAKALGSHIVTYGIDWFRDRSRNTDTSTTRVTGFGPPSTRTNNVPLVPNATFRQAGAFAQVELRPVERLTAVLGARFQDVMAATRPTPRLTAPLLESRDRSTVWSANAVYRLLQGVNVIGAVGRGFRSPNLVERFFEGAAPEGGGFQRANTDLDAETSRNVEVGARLQRRAWYLESFIFRNDIYDAIRTVATGDSVNRQPAFQNRNVGRLRISGVEATTGLQLVSGLHGSISLTRLDGRNVSTPGSPIGDSYSSKAVADVGYHQPGGVFSLGYTVRHQGEQKEVIVGTNPIGSVIPAFTTHSARAQLRLPSVRQVHNHLSLVVDNIGDKLYAEFPNASFFRPEPGRNVRLALVSQF